MNQWPPCVFDTCDNLHVAPIKERYMRRYIPLGVAAVLTFSAQAHATWKPEYASSPPELQAWYQNAELTEAAKIRFPFKKCCDHADVVLSTRIRLARNVEGYAFTPRARAPRAPTTATSIRFVISRNPQFARTTCEHHAIWQDDYYAMAHPQPSP